jgi:hypothetical protein
MHGSGWGTLLPHYQEAVATAGRRGGDA